MARYAAGPTTRYFVEMRYVAWCGSSNSGRDHGIQPRSENPPHTAPTSRRASHDRSHGLSYGGMIELSSFQVDGAAQCLRQSTRAEAKCARTTSLALIGGRTRS